MGLKAIISNQGIECDNQSINAVIRKAIWNAHLDNLQLKEVDLDVNAGEDTKRIWDKLSNVMPVYSLFQADRQNNDSDKEVVSDWGVMNMSAADADLMKCCRGHGPSGLNC